MMNHLPTAQVTTVDTTTLVLLTALGCLIVAVIAEVLPRLLARRTTAPRGITIGGPRAWGKARHVDGVLLDAWGTITNGELEVVAVDPIEADHERNLRWFAGALSHAYPDPIGRAVARLAGHGHLSNIETFGAVGISGSVDRHPVRLGRPDWVGIDDSDGVGLCVGVEVDQRPLGRITIAPAVRQGASEASQRITDLGIEPLLVADLPTRDTDRLADEAGISSRWAETAPEKRVRLVTELHEQGRTIAMVGPCSGQQEAHAEAVLSIGDGPDSDITMRDFDVTLVADALTLVRRLPRVLLINRLLVLVTLLITLPLVLLTTLHWAVPGSVLAAGLVGVLVQSGRVTAGLVEYPPEEFEE